MPIVLHIDANTDRHFHNYSLHNEKKVNCIRFDNADNCVL